MRLLWLLLTLHTAFAQVGFGRSYLRNSRLCHEWNCLNTKLGLPDSLPPREQYEVVIKSLLPEGAWHHTVDTALNICYGDRNRRYTNTCPGQALMHCLVDQFIENCPEDSLRKNDACSPVTSLAGLKYMFSQSMYENLEVNLAVERRPAWFLRNYFKTKCCRIPPFINTTLLSQCGFVNMIHYYNHLPQNGSVFMYPKTAHLVSVQVKPTYVDRVQVVSLNDTTNAGKVQVVSLNGSTNGDKVQVVSLNGSINGDKVQVVSLKDTTNPDQVQVASLKDTTETSKDLTDPLDCCNMEEFIKPTWRSECDFELSWDEQSRLSVVEKPITTTVAPSTTPKTVRDRDVMILPQSCEKETCVFQKLNIVSDTGSVNMDAFLKLLDNFTNAQPSWAKAKARVVTTCLTKPLKEYEADCDINKVLACTFDVLTENCPQAKKVNLCKHSKENRICQISSSKYRPKHRRDTCYLPDIVNRDVLTECGMDSLTQVKQAPETPVITRKKNNLMTTYSCKDQSPSTACVMSKMGILNKYGFMDHFKMKDLIRQFSGLEEWRPWMDVYLGAFTNIPMYREHCSSPKKILNVIDAMVMTCPISRRKATPQCTKIFTEMTQSAPINQQNATKERIDQILNHFHQVFWPVPLTQPKISLQPNHQYKIVKKPIYDYGILKTENAPTVQIINVKPTVKKPLVLVPVYLRLPAQNQLLRPYSNDGVLRNNPFWLHNKIAQAHLNSTTKVFPNPTISTKLTTSYNSTISESGHDYQQILP